MRYAVRRGLPRPKLTAALAASSLLFSLMAVAAQPAFASAQFPDCRGWNAVQHFGRAGTGPLTVTATCRVPTSGHSVELRRHVPQGINPADLLLDRVLIEPSGPTLPVITEVEVRYREPTDFPYKTVMILPDGPSLPVEREAKE